MTSSDITRQLFGDGLGGGGYVSTYSGPVCSHRLGPRDWTTSPMRSRVIGDASDKFNLQDASKPSMLDFFDRADDRLSSFDDWDAIPYPDIVDPTLEREPHEAYGC